MPPGVVTTTSTNPTARAPVVTEIDVAVTAPTTPAVLPNFTDDGHNMFVPVNTTTVPPPEDPFNTFNDVMVGTGAAVIVSEAPSTTAVRSVEAEVFIEKLLAA